MPPKHPRSPSPSPPSPSDTSAPEPIEEAPPPKRSKTGISLAWAPGTEVVVDDIVAGKVQNGVSNVETEVGNDRNDDEASNADGGSGSDDTDTDDDMLAGDASLTDPFTPLPVVTFGELYEELKETDRGNGIYCIYKCAEQGEKSTGNTGNVSARDRDVNEHAESSVVGCNVVISPEAFKQARRSIAAAHDLFPRTLHTEAGLSELSRFNAMKARLALAEMFRLIKSIIKGLVCEKHNGMKRSQYLRIMSAWYWDFDDLPKVDTEGLTVWCEHSAPRQVVEADEVCLLCLKSLSCDPDVSRSEPAESGAGDQQRGAADDVHAGEGVDEDSAEGNDESLGGDEGDGAQDRETHQMLGEEGASSNDADDSLGSSVDRKQQLNEEEEAELTTASAELVSKVKMVQRANCEYQPRDEHSEDGDEDDDEDDDVDDDEDDDGDALEGPEEAKTGSQTDSTEAGDEQVDEDDESEDQERSNGSQEGVLDGSDEGAEESDEDEEESDGDEEGSDEDAEGSEDEPDEEPEPEPTGLTWCRNGCGKSVHAACWSYWAKHRRNSGEVPRCLTCKGVWEERECVECDG